MQPVRTYNDTLQPVQSTVSDAVNDNNPESIASMTTLDRVFLVNGDTDFENEKSLINSLNAKDEKYSRPSFPSPPVSPATFIETASCTSTPDKSNLPEPSFNTSRKNSIMTTLFAKPSSSVSPNNGRKKSTVDFLSHSSNDLPSQSNSNNLNTLNTLNNTKGRKKSIVEGLFSSSSQSNIQPSTAERKKSLVESLFKNNDRKTSISSPLSRKGSKDIGGSRKNSDTNDLPFIMIRRPTPKHMENQIAKKNNYLGSREVFDENSTNIIRKRSDVGLVPSSTRGQKEQGTLMWRISGKVMEAKYLSFKKPGTFAVLLLIIHLLETAHDFYYQARMDSAQTTQFTSPHTQTSTSLLWVIDSNCILIFLD